MFLFFSHFLFNSSPVFSISSSTLNPIILSFSILHLPLFLSLPSLFSLSSLFPPTSHPLSIPCPPSQLFLLFSFLSLWLYSPFPCLPPSPSLPFLYSPLTLSPSISPSYYYLFFSTYSLLSPPTSLRLPSPPYPPFPPNFSILYSPPYPPSIWVGLLPPVEYFIETIRKIIKHFTWAHYHYLIRL